MLLVLLSLIATSVMDTVAHIRNKEALCMFSDLNVSLANTYFQGTTYLIVQHTLSKGVGKGGAWGAKAPPEFLNRISYYLVLYMMNSFCNCKGMVSFVLVYM